jgi:hypothetical protein
VKNLLVLLVSFLFAMACTATIAMAQAAGATASPDLATLIASLPVAAAWKQTLVAIFAFVVVCRTMAELLFAMAELLNKPGMGTVALGIYKVVRAFGAVFGYFGMGTPKEIISAKLEGALQAVPTDKLVAELKIRDADH